MEDRSGTQVTYRLDGFDRIVEVGVAWRAFAEANGWAEGARLERVLGRRIWEFLQDAETRYLYAELFRAARAGRALEPFPFRCDSPSERRFLEATIQAHPNGDLTVRTVLLRTEPRDPVRLLDPAEPRAGAFVRMCSMCKKIDAGEDTWLEIEQAISQLELFDAYPLPALTHGMCTECYRLVLEELEDEPGPRG